MILIATENHHMISPAQLRTIGRKENKADDEPTLGWQGSPLPQCRVALATSTGGEQPGLSPRRYYSVTFGASGMLDEAAPTTRWMVSPAGVTRHSDRPKRALRPET